MHPYIIYIYLAKVSIILVHFVLVCLLLTCCSSFIWLKEKLAARDSHVVLPFPTEMSRVASIAGLIIPDSFPRDVGLNPAQGIIIFPPITHFGFSMQSIYQWRHRYSHALLRSSEFDHPVIETIKPRITNYLHFCCFWLQNREGADRNAESFLANAGGESVKKR